MLNFRDILVSFIGWSYLTGLIFIEAAMVRPRRPPVSGPAGASDFECCLEREDFAHRLRVGRPGFEC